MISVLKRKKLKYLFFFSFITILSSNFQSYASTGKAVLLKEDPGSSLDKIARSLNSDLLKDDDLHHDNSVILVGEKNLSPSTKNKALFVQIQSARLCGAAGCTTSIYLNKEHHWVTILDSINGTISLLPSKHHGFYDLLINNEDRWIWDGKEYNDTSP